MEPWQVDAALQYCMPPGCAAEGGARLENGVIKASIKRAVDGWFFSVHVREDVTLPMLMDEIECLADMVRKVRVGGPDFAQGDADPGMRGVADDGVKGVVVRVDDANRTIRLKYGPKREDESDYTFDQVKWDQPKWVRP